MTLDRVQRNVIFCSIIVRKLLLEKGFTATVIHKPFFKSEILFSIERVEVIPAL